MRSSEDRMVSLRIAVRNRPSRSTTSPEGSMKALMPETAAFDHPTAGLDRAHLAHLLVLGARGGEPVGRVVHGHDEEPGAVPHERTGDLREAVLETDRSAERREPVRAERVDLLPRRTIDGDLLAAPPARRARRGRGRTRRRARDAPCRSARRGRPRRPGAGPRCARDRRGRRSPRRSRWGRPPGPRRRAPPASSAGRSWRPDRVRPRPTRPGRGGRSRAARVRRC